MSGIANQRDGGSFTKTVVGNVAKAAGSETLTGAAIDRLGFNSCKLVATVGAATGSPTSFTLDSKLTECDTSGGVYTDVTGAAITQVTAATAGAAEAPYVDVDLSGCKRYLKVVTVSALSGGSSPTLPVATVVVLTGKVTNPAS